MTDGFAFGGIGESEDEAEDLYLTGPTLSVRIGFDPGYGGGGSVPNLPAEIHRALVDTGATNSHIDSTIADALRLPVVDSAWTHGATSSERVSVYLAQVHIPAMDVTFYGRFRGANLYGRFPQVVLLGRSFLRQFTMVYEGRTGIVSLS